MKSKEISSDRLEIEKIGPKFGCKIHVRARVRAWLSSQIELRMGDTTEPRHNVFFVQDTLSSGKKQQMLGTRRRDTMFFVQDAFLSRTKTARNATPTHNDE